MTDETLLMAARAGDESAFGQLVERHGAALIGFLTKRLRNRCTAEDVSQSVWLKISTRLKDFEVGRRFTPWLYTIADNAAKDCLRVAARYRRFVEQYTPAPPNEETDRESQELALAALASLPDNQRVAIQVTILSGQSSRAVKQSLGVSHRTVLNWRNAGLAAIRSRMVA